MQKSIRLYIDSKSGASIVGKHRYYLNPTGASIKRVLDRATNTEVYPYKAGGTFVAVWYTVERE